MEEAKFLLDEDAESDLVRLHVIPWYPDFHLTRQRLCIDLGDDRWVLGEVVLETLLVDYLQGMPQGMTHENDWPFASLQLRVIGDYALVEEVIQDHTQLIERNEAGLAEAIG